MKNKGIMIAILVVIVGVAGFLLFNPKKDTSQLASEQSSKNSADSITDDKNTTPDTTNPTTSPNTTTSTKDNSEETQGQFSGEDDITSPDVAVFEVSYDGTSFSPKTTTINAGDIVVFKNDSQSDLWPASDPHPTHTNYPEFNAQKSIAPGGKFEFKFTKVGTWGYHNHKNHDATGTIIVK